MKRFFILLPFAFFSFFAFAQTKLELYKDMVTTDNLRLRTPYAENKIITVLNKGTKVKIIDIEDEKETIDGITSNWVTVEVQKDAKDKDGKPVKGLYAAGEVASGQILYKEYPGSGTAIISFLTFGRQAGKAAALEVKK